MRTDTSWLYLFAGAAAGAALVLHQQRTKVPLGSTIELRGDELAVALRRPLRHVLGDHRITLWDRSIRPGWSTTDAEIMDGPRPVVSILAVGPGKGLRIGRNSEAEELTRYANSFTWRPGGAHPVLLLAHPNAPMTSAVEEAARRAGKHVSVLRLRALPLGPDHLTPTMATAAVWAADIAAHVAP